MNFQQCCTDIIERKDKLSEKERLGKLFDLHWENLMEEYPTWATYTGYPAQNHRWTDESPEAIERRKKNVREQANVIASIDRAQLATADQLNYDLFKRNLDEAIEEQSFPEEFLMINHMSGP